MGFRVLVAGGRRFTDYRALRAALDALLANRLPDVELLTAGGPGVPMLAASYAAARRLEVTALVPDYGRFPTEAAEQRREALLVAGADAAVIVWGGDPAVRQVLALIERKGIPVYVIGGPARGKVKRVRDPEAPTARRGLPD